MRTKQARHGVLLSVLLLAGFWLLSLVWGLMGKAHIAIREADEAEKQYQMLEERKQALEQSVAALKTARGQDAAIRTAFGVARPGEEVIVVVPPATTTATSSPSWWQKILDWF